METGETSNKPEKQILLGLLLVGIALFWFGVTSLLAPDSNLVHVGIFVAIIAGAGQVLVFVGGVRWASRRIKELWEKPR